MSNKPKPPQYDPHIVPAEVGAREDREGRQFGHPVHESGQANPESIHTTDGYTVDQEGLINNYAVEPEMYLNQPGDLRQENEELRAQRLHEMEELQESEEGKLTMEHDYRHRGPGMI